MGSADILAIILVAIIDTFTGGLIFTYFFAFSISAFGLLGILYIENNYETDPSIAHLEKYEFYRRMPGLLFMVKFGLSVAIISTNISILTDSKIFPQDRRNSSVGFANMIAQLMTSLAPIINEIEEATPIVVMIVVLVISVLNAATFKMPTPPPTDNQKAQ